MEQQDRSGFWSTLPGILTGTAALVSAVTGGYLAFGRMPDKAAAATASPVENRAEPKPAALADVTPAAAPSSHAGATTVDPDERASPRPDPPPPVATRQPNPSFDCARATTAVEILVCSDADLADRDRRVAGQYFALRGTLPGEMRSQLRQSQRQFLLDRGVCRTKRCLSNLYEARLVQLAEFESSRGE